MKTIINLLFWLLVGGIIVLICTASACRPIKDLTVTKERKDSIVYRVKIDTLRITDSVKTIIERQGFNQREILEIMALMRAKKDTTIYLTGSSGKTEIHLKDGRGYLETQTKETYHAEYQRSIDSMKREIRHLTDSKQVVVKAPSWWDKFTDNLAYYVVIAFVIAACFFYLKLKK